MPTSPSQSRSRREFWRFMPVAIIVLLALGYIFAVALLDSDSMERPPNALPVVFMLAQAVLLLARHGFPLSVLIMVTVLDAFTLLLSSGEVGTGTIAVMIAVYSYIRATTGRARLLVPTGLGVITVVITVFAVQTSPLILPEFVLPFAVARNLLVFGLGVLVAEILGGRAKLLEALRERAEAAEHEKERQGQEAVLRERTLMARELHDVAAHHLTGIIVSAQAADALRSSDPEEAGEYIRQVQHAARTTLNNLRQTVGLLRADDTGELTPVASIERLPALVEEAGRSGTEVVLHESGTRQDLGTLAGIAAYRMVQESLANALNHAPGTARSVHVDYGPTAMNLTVSNSASRGRNTVTEGTRSGFGLIGMAERADLVGATLQAGPAPDGGWINSLLIPYSGGQS